MKEKKSGLLEFFFAYLVWGSRQIRNSCKLNEYIHYIFMTGTFLECFLHGVICHGPGLITTPQYFFIILIVDANNYYINTRDYNNKHFSIWEQTAKHSIALKLYD